MSLFKNSRYSIGARWIHPICSEPFENHFVNVVEGIVQSITTAPTEEDVFDFEESCRILPGTVNAHAHLELSQLAEPIAATSFPEWIGKLMQFRRSEQYDAGKGIASAMLRPEILTETAIVADIVPPDFDLDERIHSKHPVWLCFRELIAWTRDQAESKLEMLNPESFYGISPHAPQTVCPALMDNVLRLARSKKIPLAMHLAETLEELRLLKTHDGPLLDSMRRADPDYTPSKVLIGNKPLDYLQRLSEASQTLIIHGNYLDDTELRFLADHRQSMSVVYCPRSHAHFGHAPYPLKKMLDLGVRVLLGTDSLASTPDLSLVNEMRYVVEHFPGIPMDTVFRMGTLSGSEALGLDDSFGTIEPGREAVFSFF